MNEENVTLVSKDYAESVFVTGPQVDQIIGEHSEFVTGPALDQKLVQKQDKLQWYNESGGGYNPSKVDIASNNVTLRSGDDTVGIIMEDTMLELNSGISIKSQVGGEGWKNILSSGLNDCVYLGEPTTDIYCEGTLHDKNGDEIKGGGSSFNYISESDDWPTSLSLGNGPNGAVQSIFVSGPLYGYNGTIFVNGPIRFNEAYDKDGNEIRGGGAARFTTDADGNTMILGKSYSSESSGALIISTDAAFEGELGSPMIYTTGEYTSLYIGASDNFISFHRSYGSDGNVIRIKIDTEELILNKAKLEKLKQLLES